LFGILLFLAFGSQYALEARLGSFNIFLFDGVRPPVRGAAPRVGEHNVDILCDELGLARSELTALRSAGII